MADDNLYAMRESEEGSMRFFQMNGFGTKTDPFKVMASSVSDPLAISMGEVDGISGENKYGWNEDMIKDVRADVWSGGGDYVFPIGVDITHISQKADQLELRGATIVVEGLDGDWNPVIQTVILDAADTSTPVVLDTPMVRHNRCFVTVLVQATEIISVHNAANTIDFGVIPVGNNHSSGAIYSIPAGYEGYLTRYYGNAAHTTNKSPTSTVFYFEIENIPEGRGFMTLHIGGVGQDSAAIDQNFNPYAGPIRAKTDLKISAIPYGTDGFITAGFDLILKKLPEEINP